MEINLSLLKFCGMFDVDDIQKSMLSDSAFFQCDQILRERDTETWQYIQDQYYPAFRRFITNEDPEDFRDFKILTSREKKTEEVYQKTLDRHGVSKTIRFSIKQAEVFLYSQSPGIISLEVSIESNDLTLNDISAFVSSIRNYNSKISEAADAEHELTILTLIQDRILNKAIGKNPEKDTHCFNLGYDPKKPEYRGSKLKVFQCIDMKSIGSRDLQKVLFELGTLSFVGQSDGIPDYNAHSEKYYHHTITDVISVYDNWRALCLFDTFTLIGVNYLCHTATLKTWKENYFRIYTYDLYYKYYLSSLNAEGFHEAKRLKKKRSAFNEFFHLYDIYYISYNFLPNLIHHSIQKGLETNTETKGLRDKIDRITKIISERINSRTNWILFGLAVIALIPGNWGDIYSAGREHPIGYNQPNIIVNVIKILIILVIFLAQVSVLHRIKEFFQRWKKNQR